LIGATGRFKSSIDQAKTHVPPAGRQIRVLAARRDDCSRLGPALLKREIKEIQQILALETESARRYAESQVLSPDQRAGVAITDLTPITDVRTIEIDRPLVITDVVIGRINRPTVDFAHVDIGAIVQVGIVDVGVAVDSISRRNHDTEWRGRRRNNHNGRGRARWRRNDNCNGV
jgi:hypothetical protein